MNEGGIEAAARRAVGHERTGSGTKTPMFAIELPLVVHPDAVISQHPGVPVPTKSTPQQPAVASHSAVHAAYVVMPLACPVFWQ